MIPARWQTSGPDRYLTRKLPERCSEFGVAQLEQSHFVIFQTQATLIH